MVEQLVNLNQQDKVVEAVEQLQAGTTGAGGDAEVPTSLAGASGGSWCNFLYILFHPLELRLVEEEVEVQDSNGRQGSGGTPGGGPGASNASTGGAGADGGGSMVVQLVQQIQAVKVDVVQLEQ